MYKGGGWARSRGARLSILHQFGKKKRTQACLFEHLECLNTKALLSLALGVLTLIRLHGTIMVTYRLVSMCLDRWSPISHLFRGLSSNLRVTYVSVPFSHGGGGLHMSRCGRWHCRIIPSNRRWRWSACTKPTRQILYVLDSVSNTSRCGMIIEKVKRTCNQKRWNWLPKQTPQNNLAYSFHLLIKYPSNEVVLVIIVCLSSRFPSKPS